MQIQTPGAQEPVEVSTTKIVLAALINISVRAIVGIAVVFVLVELLAGVALSWQELTAFGLLAAWIKGI